VCGVSNWLWISPLCFPFPTSSSYTLFTERKGRGTRHAQDSSRVLGMIAEPNRNRRASTHRSPLAHIPLEKLCSGRRGDLLVYQEHAATSSLQDDQFTSALDDPILVSLPDYPQAVPDPRWKIPPSAWATVLQRVEQGEPLRHIARDYGVSYEAIRRVLRAARRR
jgi:hypothetical protein